MYKWCVITVYFIICFNDLLTGTAPVSTTTISSVASWQGTQYHVTEATPTADTGPVLLALHHLTPPPFSPENVDSDPSLHSASSVEHVR